jgi:outer membrane lipoprotein SlyB
LGGAAAGALIGGIADGNWGQGAAIGAAAGGLFGAHRKSSTNRRNQQNQEAWEQQQAQIYAQRRHQYNRAYSACLTGRGYTVN